MPPQGAMATPADTAAAGPEPESIYNLLPKTYSTPSKPSLFRSPRLRHAARQPPVGSTIGAFGGPHRRAWATWGPAASQATDPKHFLRRGAGHKSRPVLQSLSTTPSVHDRHAEMRKPPVPSHVCPSSSGSERVVYDHIYANAMDAITAAPPPPPTEAEIDYLRKPDYGQVPAYLAAVKEEIRREDAILARFLQRRRQGSHGDEDKEGALRGVVAPLAEAERRALVDALKAKWDAVEAAYQKNAHLGGRHGLSWGARRRKEAQERALQQLEADIELLERGGTAGGIYVRYGAADGPAKANPSAAAAAGGPAAA